jgi:hypothetical protein
MKKAVLLLAAIVLALSLVGCRVSDSTRRVRYVAPNTLPNTTTTNRRATTTVPRNATTRRAITPRTSANPRTTAKRRTATARRRMMPRAGMNPAVSASPYVSANPRTDMTRRGTTPRNVIPGTARNPVIPPVIPYPNGTVAAPMPVPQQLYPGIAENPNTGIATIPQYSMPNAMPIYPVA